MTGICVLGDVAEGMQQLYLNLKRRVGQFAKKLRLSDNLGRHQI